MKITPHLDTDEVQCRCGCGLGKIPAETSTVLAQLFEDIRMCHARSLIVSSGHRCESWNARQGGVPDSAHLRGTALDIVAYGGEARYQLVVGAVLAALVQSGIIERPQMYEAYEAVKKVLKGIGIANSFIHFDVDTKLPRPSCWRYGDSERR